MRRVSMLSLVLLVGSCSGSDGVTADEFKAGYPKAYCDHVFRCCDADERSFGSSLICEQQVAEEVGELLAFSAASTAFAQFLPAAGKKCLDSLSQPSCDDVSLVDPGCASSTVQPQHKQGEECSYSSECQSYYCIQPQKLARGSCGPAGEPHCSGDNRSCREGHACVGNECVLKKGVAQGCGSARECESAICSATTKSCYPRPSPFCDGK